MGAASLAGPRKLPGSKLVLARLGDERLVEQLRRGNAVAFEVIFDRHHRSLLSFCAHMLHSREAGEEAVQQTFLSAYNAVASDAKRPEKLKSWLFAIARNRCLSILRARREEQPLADEPAAATSATPELQAEQRAETRELLADLRELPEEQRAALVLSQVGDLSHADVAGALGCPTLKVKSLVFQARSALLERRAARELPCDEGPS